MDALLVASVGLVLLLFLFLTVRLQIGRGVRCKLSQRLDGKTVVITGATSGIGRAVAHEIAQRGAIVVLACRNSAKAEELTLSIRKKSGNSAVSFLVLDLASLTSVLSFVDVLLRRFGYVDILINNAAYMGPKMKTKDDLDMTLQVNYLSQFLLTTTLIREQQHKMTQEQPLRVINLMSSGIAHTRLDFDDLMCDKRQRDIYSSYSASKLALMLFTCRLHHVYTFTTPARVHVMAVNPGATQTELQSHWPGIGGKLLRLCATLLFRTADAGAQTVIFAALTDRPEEYGGKLLHDCASVDIPTHASDLISAEKLWLISSEICRYKLGT